MPQAKPRLNRDGTVTWRVQYRVAGKVVQDSFTTVEAGDEFCRLIDTVGGEQARKVLESRRHGVYAPTLNEWATTYLDAESGILTGIEDGTREGYAHEADRTFLPFLGQYPVDAITPDDVGKWITWQERQTVHRDRAKPEAERATVSSKTVKNAHALLSAMLGAAAQRGLRDGNPAHGARISKGLRREAVFLSPAEFATVLHFIPPKHRPLVMFLAGTGARWGEATAVTWADLTLHGTPQTIRITKAWKRGTKGSAVLKHPKSSKARRTISLFPDLVAIIGKPADPSDLIFRSETGTRVRHQNFSDRVWRRAIAKAIDKDACREAGVTALAQAPTIHDLRHTHASWLISRGVPLPYIQARLGHEKITTTVDTYGHLVPDAHEQMASVVAATLAGIAPAAMGELEPPEDDEPHLPVGELLQD